MSHKIFRLVSSLFLALAVLGLGLNIQPVHAAGPWYVAPSGNDSNTCLSPSAACATINGALTKPGFISGDTVRVAIGIYTSTGNEVVLLNNNATLAGGWDASFTIQSGMSTIDGEGVRRGVRVDSFVTIERFVMQNGFGSSGGGIFTSTNGNLILNYSTVSNNNAVNGGGIIVVGPTVLNNSTVSGNSASNIGGGIWNLNGTLTLNNSTISGNTAGAGGGGIKDDGFMAILNNSTVSSNTALGNGGGINYGSNTLILNNSSVNGNMAGSMGGGLSSDTTGGIVTLQNTILSGNTAGIGPDCSGIIGSSGYNLIGNNSDCTFTSATGDLTNVDPLLGPLQDNGGPTFTQALLSGSPAIDAGNPAGCTDQNGNLLTTDQRGVARPQGTRCDIGAFELETTGGGSEEVTIDIKPGSRVNPINPRSSGKIPVAILSTPDFNAPAEVDRASLTFGSTGNEHSLVSCNKKGTDVNGDGLRDLVCHFKTKLTAFKFGDTEGILKGQTLGGVPIEGSDVVRVLHASYP